MMEDYSKSPVKKKAASNDEEFYDFDQSLLSSQYQSPLLSTSPDPNQKRDRLTRSEHSSIIINERQGAFDLEDCDWKQRLYLNTSESESFLHLESQSQLYSSLRNNHSFTHGQSGVGHSKTFFNFPKVSSNHKNLPDNHQDIFDNTPVLYEWQSPSTEPLNMFEKTILNDEEHVGLKNFDQQFLDKDTLVDTITNNNTDKFNLIKNVGIGERRSSMCTIPNDGVFSNLTARPEIMVLPKDAEDDLPPAYDGPSTSLDSRFFPGMTGGVGGLAMVNGTGASVELEEVIIEDLEVGPYAVYALYLVVSMFFELFGFAISYFLSQSHAARCGAISGLGVTIALQSIRVDDLIAGSSFFKSNPSIKPIITFVLAFSGYVIFLFGIFSYHRRRIEAREMLALHTQPITTPQS